jgi:hypothetical protein
LQLHDIVKVLLILSIGVIVAGVMISSIVLGGPVEEKAVYALIGLFVIAIAIFNEGHMHNPVLLKAVRKVNGRIGNQRN